MLSNLKQSGFAMLFVVVLICQVMRFYINQTLIIDYFYMYEWWSND